MSARPARRRRVASVRTDGRTDGVRERILRRATYAPACAPGARATADSRLRFKRPVSRYRRHMRHLVTSPRSAAPAGIPHASTLYVRCMIVVQQQGYRNDPPRRRVSYARSAAGGPGGGTLVAMAGLRPQISVSAGQELCDLLGAAASPPGPTHCARPPGRAISRSDHTRHIWDDGCALTPPTLSRIVRQDRATFLLIWQQVIIYRRCNPAPGRSYWHAT